ncbi:delta-aminolevulinic acid dehydratase [Pseudoflavitalea sp. G-6-1-2]|uniref:delta-aminolevulinic acid dehydratase n=1 Tax=Pseudoflavitalea sp. G-6-1-2 TaxID=2728841 RepID=UPI001469E2B4|nr:delta-aminolevulinic acid dehydratase [Pseudoflavitalea sp. G-6-1-2]NML20607.1 delta-aminolevulinic acid dehydratase [Pseudoflavitalea sp. G-6-1-2]
MNVPEVFESLKTYCEKEEFMGWDPYDGLTSRVFQSLPLIRSNKYCRLAWIQFFKRSPVNFRKPALIAKQHNAKGLALFLTGYCHLYQLHGKKEYLEKINYLANKIIALQSQGYAGSCWGYYFDWQARAFFQPAHTPTVVATSFVADALFDAYELTKEEKYKEVAVSSADFVLKDLNRTYDAKGDFSFSYSPLDHTQVFNASLLGAKLLSRVYAYTQNTVLKEEATKAVRFACNFQQPNGAWAYGTLPFHTWIDSFHTGFNLECIYAFQKYTGVTDFNNHIEKGLAYYTANFFTPEGISKYYNQQTYPVDAHAPAQFLVTMAKLNRFEEHRPMIEKVLGWTIQNMYNKKGFFYYQKRKRFSSKIPYMRWAQAWMFVAMTHYLKATQTNQYA